MLIENYVTNDLIEVSKSLKKEFGLDDSIDPKDYSFQMIEYYKAISLRRLELTVQSLDTQIKKLNAILEIFKNQTSLNTSGIITAINNIFN